MFAWRSLHLLDIVLANVDIDVKQSCYSFKWQATARSRDTE